ncbi:MAG: DUF4142 domain-containing protein [Sinobacteraceae bacterium]|nr:DUF4142 domain-containing protein [Nevskiaceae bacterium]
MRISTILTSAGASLLVAVFSLSNAQAQSSQSTQSGGSSNPPTSHSGSYDSSRDNSRADNSRADNDSSSAANGPASDDRAANSSLSSQEFVKRATEANLAEIKVSQLASSQAQSAEVKRFAQQMIDDHTKANSELAKVAQNKNLKVPDDTDMTHKASMKMLEHKSGESFDSAYMKQMDKDHQKTIELFQSAASSPKVDRELQALASKLLPKLQQHEQMVTQIESKSPSRSASSR